MSPHGPSDPDPVVRTSPAAGPPGRFSSGPPGRLEAVRLAAAEVAGRSRFVHLAPERMGAYADRLVAEGVVPDRSGDAETGPWGRAEGDDETVVGTVLALAAINFGSGWHDVVRKRLGRSGARNMAAGLRAWLDEVGTSADHLCRLDSDTAHRLFDQPHDDGPVDELMGLFTIALNDLGALVLDHHDGSFLALVAAAGGSADTMVVQLEALAFFRDVTPYEDMAVPMYKRAQLVSADLHRAFGGAGPGRFDDLDLLTAFADNLVPHVLRLDGLLEYDPELLARIDAGELLVAGSPEEVEIRALGVHAVERLRAALAERGHDVPSWRLDGLLWERGSQPHYKAVPRHRARSVFY